MACPTPQNDWLTFDYLISALCEATKQAGDQITKDEATAMFSRQHTKDLRGIPQRGVRVVRRGGVPYRMPSGWFRFSLQLGNKYGRDQDWLHARDPSRQWAIAFHGTGLGQVVGILRRGLKPGKGQGGHNAVDTRTGETIGEGVFVTPNIEVAQAFANGYRKSKHKNSSAFEHQGHRVYAVLQCRVRPDAIRRGSRRSTLSNDEEVMGLEGVFEWILNNGDDVRPHALLIKEAGRDPRSLELLGDRDGSTWHGNHKPAQRLYHLQPTPGMLASYNHALVAYSKVNQLRSGDRQPVTLGQGSWQWRYEDENSSVWEGITSDYFTAAADLAQECADSQVPWRGRFVDLRRETLTIKPANRVIVLRRVDDSGTVILPQVATTPGVPGSDHVTRSSCGMPLKIALRVGMKVVVGVLKLQVKLTPELATVGTVVRRGPDWKWGDVDCKGAGTVIRPDRVQVLWNAGGAHSYRVGAEGAYDLKLAEAQGGLAVDTVLTQETAEPSMKVVRGPDWQGENQDAGGIGVINAWSDWVQVRWSSGDAIFCRVGADRSYDLVLANPKRCPKRHLMVFQLEKPGDGHSCGKCLTSGEDTAFYLCSKCGFRKCENC
mmetsp:Transcript_61865/g.142476  ORF Transcript_61865/g.142476 Transcript_61865/m.142476 type:complete len:603 (-) Transcript_61865:384-2192(-)